MYQNIYFPLGRFYPLRVPSFDKSLSPPWVFHPPAYTTSISHSVVRYFTEPGSLRWVIPLSHPTHGRLPSSPLGVTVRFARGRGWLGRYSLAGLSSLEVPFSENFETKTKPIPMKWQLQKPNTKPIFILPKIPIINQILTRASSKYR